ncbi:M50 family metallopeptidase [Smaragdicoccus niigatensis]|uniref:M50 family metallopeptidase n=1 Tax=Smaragdicoccus niigatensis TaxID=359359 RepID=UPI00037C6269|nr:M50 family metallopeptidase [Smaragdicoccus niigatensis]
MDQILDTLGDYTALVAALALVVLLWTVVRHVVTIVHEGGHALAALATGRQLVGIRLHSDTSGLTLSRGKPYGAGMVVTAAAGYLAPPLAAMFVAFLMSEGHLRFLGLVTLAAVAIMLIFIRNVFGALLLVGAIVGLIWLDGHSTVDLQGQLFFVLAWLLVLGNLRTISETTRNRTGRTDVDGLWRLTHIPRGLWIAVLYTVTVGAGAVVWNLQGLQIPVI